MSEDIAEELPGLQPERTALAWDRTGVAFIVVGALMMRAGGTPYHHPRHAPAAVAILVGGVLIYGAARRYSRQDRGEVPPAAPDWWKRAVGLLAVGLSAAALLVTIAGG